MSRLWCIRQYACIDANGRVVDIPTKKGIGNKDVVGWRIRWDAPARPGRSRTFTKSRFDTATAAHEAAEEYSDLLRAAARHDYPADDRGRPVPPQSDPGTARDQGLRLEAERLTFEALGREWIAANGGQPKTVQQHENSVRFALEHLPEGIAADDITTAQMRQVHIARRYTPSIRARKLVRMGKLHPDDEEARMCSVQTEKVFVQDVRAIFEYGMQRKPSAVHGNPMVGIAPRKKSDESVDPSSEVTFSPLQFLGIAELIADLVFRALVILRGFTAVRTGEFARLTVDDVDLVHQQFRLPGTEGEAPSRLTRDGSSRTQNKLKQRAARDDRWVDYPTAPYIVNLMDALVMEARRRHTMREQALVSRCERYKTERGKQHLLAKTEKELRRHRTSAPRLITMPDGSPFRISRFDRDIWKPVLRKYFPIDDPTDEEYNPLRETRFYNLRAAAIELWNEEGGMDESDAAAMAGHSVDVQRRHYRKKRGGSRRRSRGVDDAAQAASIQVFGSTDDVALGRASSRLRWHVLRQDSNGNRFTINFYDERTKAQAAVDELQRKTHDEVYWAEPTATGTDRDGDDHKLSV